MTTLEGLRAEALEIYTKHNLSQRDWSRLHTLWERIGRYTKAEQDATPRQEQNA